MKCNTTLKAFSFFYNLIFLAYFLPLTKNTFLILIRILLLLFSHSVVSDSLQPHGLQHTRLPCPSPSPGAYSKLMPTELVMPSTHLVLSRPLLFLPSIFPNIKVFSNEMALHIRWPKYWSFRFSISPSNEHSRLISFKMDWISLQSKGLSRVFSNTIVQKHQFFGTQPSLWPNSDTPTWHLKQKCSYFN